MRPMTALAPRLALAIFPALLLVAAPLGAQTVEAGIAGVDGRHRLLAPLGGPMLQVVFGDPRSNVRWQAGAERVTGGQDRMGVPCVGLVGPGEDCSPTPMHDDATLTMLGAGPRIALLRRARFQLDAILTGRFGRVEATSVAPARGDAQFVAGQQVLGIDVGACAGWRPFARVPIAATVALSAGRLTPLSVTATADGYEPFQETIPYARMQVGLSWR
jgi:hypothetical protein